MAALTIRDDAFEIPDDDTSDDDFVAVLRRKIVTTHVYPPTPDRSHDWCAHYEGEEENGGYGWGRTEAEAIADFKAIHEDDEEAA